MPTEDYELTVRRTYYGLRVGLVVLAVGLFCGIVVQLVTAGCMQDSISAYYYTPVRPVFIAALCAVGALLIIYRGNTAGENALLNLAGFLAIVVSFVPTGFGVDARGCAAVDIADKSAAITNNIITLLVAAVLAVLASRLKFGAIDSAGADTRTASRWSFGAALIVTILLIVTFIADLPLFLARAHMASAILFFAAILAVIKLNANAAQHPYRLLYNVFFWGSIGLGLALITARLALPGFRTVVFWLETVGILGYTGFWALQTVELGGAIRRSE